MRGRWNEDFFRKSGPIVLELGCGKGEYTVGLAKQFPDKNFIGIDIKGARMWHGAKQALQDSLGNVAFLRTHIELLSHFFAPQEVSEIWITFPDPQMNKVNRRLTSTRFMSLYSSILRPEGLIHLKTDSAFLYNYTSAMLHLNHFPVKIQTANLYSELQNDPILGICTYYEQQWLGRGINIKYLCFACPHRVSYSEPEEYFEKDEYRSFGRKGAESLNIAK